VFADQGASFVSGAKRYKTRHDKHVFSSSRRNCYSFAYPNSGATLCWSAVDVPSYKLLIYLVLLVPGEGFETPANGLQIRPSSSLGSKQKESKNNQMLDGGAFFMSQSLATATIGFQGFSRSGGSSTRHETRHGEVLRHRRL
jgi:hypothetical protein